MRNTTLPPTVLLLASSVETLPPHNPDHMAHFIAIQAATGELLAKSARELASALTPRELRTWLDELSKLSIPQAVAKFKTMF